MNTIEGVIVNDRFLESIAINLHEEAKHARAGDRFKKIIPALAFYCFTLESKLLTYGKAVFTKRSEYRCYTNATLPVKFEWLTNRLEVPDVEPVQKCKITISEMAAFRNAVTHSKNINVKLNRELTGLELFNDRYVRIYDDEKDFMASSTLEKLNEFSQAIWILEQVWMIDGKKHFKGDCASLLVGMTRGKVVNRDQEA
ncbi:hypothetical protein [Pantoea agglomerans]|uniref:hypothetical protein n=1 Tax=Enterobacter agglomerans TaxID=549 RepID=UPI002B1D441E|nr:hypothetical protein [Pantoea agglomerans]